MITRQDVLEAIAECQGTRSPNANTAVKLAAFYTILDHLDDRQSAPAAIDRNSFVGYSLADGADVVKYDGNSDFAKIVNGMPQSRVWPIIDELLTTIRLMNERLYNGVMKKLSN